MYSESSVRHAISCWRGYNLNILHIGDMAGVGAILSNICTELGHPSMVVQEKTINTFNHGEFYGNTNFLNSKEEIEEFVIKGKSYFDHIIYHDRFELALKLDHLHIPSSYMFHGNMLRQQKDLAEIVSDLESIDNTFVTTEDLLKYSPESELLNRPIDMDLFKPMSLKKKALALCLTQERFKTDILYLMRKHEPEIGMFIVDRIKSVTPYQDMPRFLSSFKYYIDLKFQPSHPPYLIPELSMTGLQSLACGIPVFGGDLKWHYTLSPSNYDENSAIEFIRVLQE